MWELKYGEHEETMWARLGDASHIPDQLKNAPVLMDGQEFYWNAFWRLSSDRPVGMGLGPIPFSSVVMYASLYDMDHEGLTELAHIMQGMDNAFLKYQQEKSDKEKKRGIKTQENKKGK